MLPFCLDRAEKESRLRLPLFEKMPCDAAATQLGITKSCPPLEAGAERGALRRHVGAFVATRT
jgi:hypothetical protein